MVASTQLQPMPGRRFLGKEAGGLRRNLFKESVECEAAKLCPEPDRRLCSSGQGGIEQYQSPRLEKNSDGYERAVPCGTLLNKATEMGQSNGQINRYINGLADGHARRACVPVQCGSRSLAHSLSLF